MPATIAVLSPGEMGSSVARVLVEGGHRVVTTLGGRSQGSAARAAAAGFTVLPDLAAVVADATLIVSVVPPAAAEPLAAAVAKALAPATRKPLYLDANSIGPETAERVARAVSAAGAEFVDGGIIGGAHDLHGRSRFYLSGPRAAEAAALLAPLNLTVLGDRAGQASAFKVLYAGVTKGLSAMGMELLAGAERLGVRDDLLVKLQTDWPDVARFFARNLPGLPPRARRRAQEMDELAETLEHLGIAAPVARGAQQGLDAMADRQAQRPAPAEPGLDEAVRWWASPS